jgi:synaptobrevin family protein YKT6
MRVLFSALYKKGSEAPGKDGPVLLTSASELSSIGYFQRRTVGEMMVFFSRQFAKGAKDPGQRSSVKEQGFLCHVYVSPAGVVAACFADEEYPTRVAFGYLSKLCEDFLQATGGNLGAARADGAYDAVFQATHTRLLTQFQDPAQADQLTRIMAELEQTKLVRALFLYSLQPRRRFSLALNNSLAHTAGACASATIMELEQTKLVRTQCPI